MSAFIVSDETMHRVVQALDRVNSTPDDLGRTIMGVMLFAMNNDAIRERYSNRHPDMFVDPSNYAYEAREASTGALYRAVACFTYQCSEGDVPHSTLFKLVSRVEHDLEKELTSDPVPSDERTNNAMELTEDQPWDF